jgi:tetratricopeptide (TPR) repeat protein
VLVLCAARRELIESRPAWGGPTSTGFIVELEPLPAGEVALLVGALSEAPLESEVERRIVEHAGGNPLFAEQLLALAREAPDMSVEETPPNVEALLASRLDRLDPRELALLRRASVIGRRFTREELADITPREELGRAEHDLSGLTTRALIHPRQHVFAFHHALVRDVAYRGIPKSERAELHELAARGLDRRNGADELVGYHFERAYRSLEEIQRVDARARELAAAAGDRLGRAGIRAWQRADAPAAVNLLTRAVELAPEPAELTCELGLVMFVSGDTERARSLLERAATTDDERVAARARVELVNVLSLSEPDHADELLEVASSSIPILEAAHDDRALGRIWLLRANAVGGFFCQYVAAEEAAARAVDHYRRAGWSPSTALQNLGAALFFGPKSVEDAIAQLESLLRGFDRDHASEANVLMWLGGLEAMRGFPDKGCAEIELAQTYFAQLGLHGAEKDDCERMLGFVSLLAGDPAAGAEHLRRACLGIREHGQAQVLATRAGELANALYANARFDEAEEWVRVAQDCAGDDDLDAALAWTPVAARLDARRGAPTQGRDRLHELLRVTPPDALHHRAEALHALSEVLRLSGCTEEAGEALATAVELYERKGNVAAVHLLQRSEEPQRDSSLLR